VRKKYISACRFANERQVPFGLTGRGYKFSLDVSGQSVQIQIKLPDGNFHLACVPSHYFYDLKIVPVKDGFSIRFRNKLKDYKKDVYGPWYEATLKEIQLQKRGGNLYVYFPYSIAADTTNESAAWFFRSAELNQKYLDEMPDQLTVAAFDLNLSNPLVAAVADITKNGDGPIRVLDFGSAEIVCPATIICKNAPSRSTINGLSSAMNKLKGIIREYKACKRQGLGISDESMGWLLKWSRVRLDNGKEQSITFVRRLIQNTMGRLFDRATKKVKASRDRGHTDLSENVALLRMLDTRESLVNAYQNLHLTAGQRCIYRRNARNSRQRFRKYVSLQYGAEIVKYCRKAGAKLIFIEDLNLEFDRDSSSNSISRLFAAGQLITSIQNACNKAGIEVVLVDPAGTSQRDPVTGDIGLRPKYGEKGLPGRYRSKDYLFVERDGELGILNADEAAATNILLTGLNRSIFKHKIWIGKEGKIEEDSGVPDFLPREETGAGVGEKPEIRKKPRKRLTALVRRAKLNGYFKQDGEEVTAIASKKESTVVQKAWLYLLPPNFGGSWRFLTKEQVEKRRNRFKDVLAAKGGLQVFSLNPCSTASYRSFCVDETRDCRKDITHKELSETRSG
jgi:IS605 OrfB family transposase